MLTLPESVPIVSVYRDIATKVDEEVRNLDKENSASQVEARYDPT